MSNDIAKYGEGALILKILPELECTDGLKDVEMEVYIDTEYVGNCNFCTRGKYEIKDVLEYWFHNQYRTDIRMLEDIRRELDL